MGTKAKEIALFKIRLAADSNMKKARKLVSAGYAMKDGVSIYRSMSFETAEEVDAYLTSLDIKHGQVQKLVSASKEG